MLINRTVVIVESVHLVGRLNALLKEAGLPSPFVIATFGRLKDVPPSARLHKNDIESSRSILNHQVVDKLCGIEDSLVYVATDNDIEGELIARDAVEIINSSTNDIRRVSFEALTVDSITEALSKPRSIDNDLVQTCLSRRSIDKQIDQFSPGAGRVLSYALGQLSNPIPPSDREQMLSEISLSGINTISLLAHGITHGAKPAEVSHSLQKLYAQGRITYPRTLAGISSSRNMLASMDPHGAIEATNNHSAHHYDTSIDNLLLDAIRNGRTALRRGQAGTPPLDALLTLYKMPYMRASTISHHADRVSRCIGGKSLSLTGYGWNAYRQASSTLPSLCTPTGSLALHKILHDDSLNHKERVSTALVHLGIEGGDKERGRPIFNYPDTDTDQAPSPLGPEA